jgi:hypothetical protein
MVESVKLEKETHMTLNPSGKIIKNNKQYHIYLSVYTTHRGLTTLPVVTGTGLYFTSFYLYQKKYVKSATFCHCLLHALGGGIDVQGLLL